MEEDISRYNLSGVNEVFPEEEDNWTFVQSEEIANEKKKFLNVRQQEDTSDNLSEQGSDSGSSIVVIDSSSILLCDKSSGFVNMEDMSNELLKPEEQQEGFDVSDNISCTSQQSSNEFLKESSPYEEIEQPDSWDCEHEINQHDINKDLNVEEWQCKNQEPDKQSVSLYQPAVKDIESSTLLDVTLVTTDALEKMEGTVMEGQDLTNHTDDSVSVEEKGGTCDGKEGLKEDVLNYNLLCDREENNDVDVAETADISFLMSRKVYFDRNLRTGQEDKIDDQSSDSVEEESEDETWDLSLGALPNTNSMTSSRSSLLPQQPSPSPIPYFAEEQRIHLIMKPDLLEEANRIEELDQLDLSNTGLPPELNVANIVRDRHYVHHPNQRLNLQLSYVVAFALAAVIGFALGNIIGLSDNFPPRCNLSEEMKPKNQYEGWTEADWRSELKRLTEYNEGLSKALRDLPSQRSSCRFDFQINELLAENWDLKQSIGRIRYGKPTRSIEDRDTINHLQTENEELRATVGKLRYRCGQPVSTSRGQGSNSPSQTESPVPRLYVSDPLQKTLGEMNLTKSWNHLFNFANNRSTEDQLNGVKDSATSLVHLIALRRDDLDIMTRENRSQASVKMEETFRKSAQKTIELLESVNKEYESFITFLTEAEFRLEKTQLKLEARWKDLLKFYSEPSNQFKTAVSERSLNADWFFAMGQQREKIRRNEKQSDWIFDRARTREQERRNRKFQTKKKQKTFQGNSWNQYSS